MKPNTIDNAIEFLKENKNKNLELTNLGLIEVGDIIYRYAQSLQAQDLNTDNVSKPSPEGNEARSAEEILRAIFDGRFMIGWNDALKAMHEYRSQSLPSVTDEEIEKTANEYAEDMEQSYTAPVADEKFDSWIEGAKWMRSKLTPSDRKEK